MFQKISEMKQTVDEVCTIFDKYQDGPLTKFTVSKRFPVK